MEIGIAQLLPSFGCDSSVTDNQVYHEEVELAALADTMDYDHIWAVEHHFEDYSFCPDNFVYLSHLAARTKRIKLATGAVIVPWHLQPMRIAERAAMLDQLTNGRFMLGLGRGLARREFDQFGIAMDESRERYDEAAPLIIEALETGFWPEHEGKYFKTPRVPLRPAPYSNEWRDHRFTQVAMSPDSAEQAARLGAQVMAFNYKPIEQMKGDAEARQAWSRYIPQLLQGSITTDVTLQWRQYKLPAGKYGISLGLDEAGKWNLILIRGERPMGRIPLDTTDAAFKADYLNMNLMSAGSDSFRLGFHYGNMAAAVQFEVVAAESQE